MTSTDGRGAEEDIRRTALELQEATAEDFVRLLRSKPDGQVLVQAEFEVRQIAHRIAAVIAQAEVNARQKATVFRVKA